MLSISMPVSGRRDSMLVAGCTVAFISMSFVAFAVVLTFREQLIGWWACQNRSPALAGASFSLYLFSDQSPEMVPKARSKKCRNVQKGAHPQFVAHVKNPHVWHRGARIVEVMFCAPFGPSFGAVLEHLAYFLPRGLSYEAQGCPRH